MKWKCSDLKCIRKPTWSWFSLTHLPVQPLSRVKSLDGPRVRVISPVWKEKVYGGKDLLKSQVLSSEWNTERVREDASGDSEDGEDDKLPCVIGESAGDCSTVVLNNYNIMNERMNKSHWPLSRHCEILGHSYSTCGYFTVW